MLSQVILKAIKMITLHHWDILKPGDNGVKILECIPQAVTAKMSLESNPVDPGLILEGA